MPDNINDNEKQKSKIDIQIASHDINNLLNNILNGIEILEDNIKNDSNSAVLTQIKKSTLLASNIAQNLTENKNVVTNNKTEIELNELVDDTIKLFKGGFTANLIIEFNRTNDKYIVLGNYSDLQRVIVNLISNAMEANQGEITKINITTQQFRETVTLTIADNGPGILEDKINNIFEPGYSTNNNSSNKGLGLFIVKKVVTEHSGDINVIRNNNIGTTFKLSFPLLNKNIFDNDYSSKKVLIAEDDKFQREVLKDLLTSLKVNVFTASNGLEALDVFIKNKPDLLFIDDTMPNMTGIECSKKIREFDKESPIVLVTGSDKKFDEFEGNFSSVLKKPYSFQAIKSIVSQLL